MQYEGIGATGAHTAWLDRIMDKVIMYLCAEGKLDSALAIDVDIAEKVKCCFAGTVLEASRLMKSTAGAEEGFAEDWDESDDDDNEED